MHDTLALLYAHDCGHDHAELAAGDGSLGKIIKAVKAAFNEAAAFVHGKKKYTPSMLKDPVIKKVITTTNKALQQAISKSITHEMPQVMKEALQKNVFYFSGMKTHAQMSEVSGMLTDKDGTLKPLATFTEDVKKVNDAYNDNYLRAERNFAAKSSQMAAKWQKYEQGKARYNLRYLTDNGPNVRDSHRALEFTTLPVDDPFWDKYTPPNGYNCHCFLVQVHKDEYPESDSTEAIAKGDAATTQINKDGVNKAEIFRFNPGKEMKVMPPDHPYTSGDCGKLAAAWHTLSAMQRIQLAGHADKCKAKKVVEEMDRVKREIKKSREEARNWGKENIPPEGKIFKTGRKDLPEILYKNSDIKSITGKPHELSKELHQSVKQLPQLLKDATFIGTSPDDDAHPNVKEWRYYEFKLGDKKSYFNIMKTDEGFRIHSVSDEKGFDTNKVKNKKV